MRNLFITLGIGLAMTGCFKSTAKVSSGKFAALETQLAASSTGASSSSISGGSGTTNGSLPTSVQAQVNYVGSFYNYQNPTVTMGQTVFAMGDGALMIYGANFTNDPATTIILRNASNLQQTVLPASQFIIGPSQIQMKSGFQIPSALAGGSGLFYLIVKNANSSESSPYQMTILEPRPKLEYRKVTNVTRNGTLLSNPPVVGPLVSEAIISSNDIYNTGSIPDSAYVQVKNAGAKAVTLIHSNFFNSSNNQFYTIQDMGLLDIADTTAFLEANAQFTGWPANVKVCKGGLTLNAGEVCYYSVTLNASLSQGAVLSNPNCYDFVRQHTIEYIESAPVGLPSIFQKFNIHAKAYGSSVPLACLSTTSTSFQAASSVSSFSTMNTGQFGTITSTSSSSASTILQYSGGAGAIPSY